MTSNRCTIHNKFLLSQWLDLKRAHKYSIELLNCVPMNDFNCCCFLLKYLSCGWLRPGRCLNCSIPLPEPSHISWMWPSSSFQCGWTGDSRFRLEWVFFPVWLRLLLLHGSHDKFQCSPYYTIIQTLKVRMIFYYFVFQLNMHQYPI